jgi:hypothetical protein
VRRSSRPGNLGRGTSRRFTTPNIVCRSGDVTLRV